jgi:hypothetical protein
MKIYVYFTTTFTSSTSLHLHQLKAKVVRLVLVGHFRSPIDFKVSHAGVVF